MTWNWLSYRTAVGIFLLVSAGGCNQEVIEPGSESDAALVTVVSDLYLEEARFQLLLTTPDVATLSVEDLGSGLPPARRDSILRLHGFSETSFDESMDPYLNDPDQLQTFYDRVLDRLSEQRQKLRDP